jgi:protein SCO1/2
MRVMCRHGGLLLAAFLVAPLTGPRAPGAEEAARYGRTTKAYVVPDVTLLNQEGVRVRLPTLLDAETPLLLSFLFTTCRTICPVITSTLARMRQELGGEGRGMRLVSVTIDPDHDRPAVLDEYARRHHTGEGWQFLTGTPDEVSTVLRAFDAYAGGRTSHRPIVLLRAPGRSDWVRIDGIASASDLAREYRRLLGG